MSIDNVFVPKQGALSDLAAWIAGDLGASYVRLYVNNQVYTPNRVPADYTEASFAGYAPVHAIAWLAPFINGSGKAETDSPPFTYTFTAGVGTVTLFGLFVTDLALTKLLLVAPFVMPVVLSPGQNILTRTLQITDTSEL
jgi:hypothetical protein